MNFIDFHTHVYPYKIAIKATDILSRGFERPAEWPATAENLCIFQIAAGITRSVVLPVAIKAEQVRKINEFVAESMAEFPGHIIGFGALHAAQEKLLEEIDFIRQQGLRGIKLHPDQQGFALDDRRLFDAYRYLSELGLPILFHCGNQKNDLSHPRRLKRLIGEFPRLNIVAAHFGGWTIFDEAYDILRHEEIHFDMSSSLYLMGEEKTARFIRDYGVEKIFFGTDFPLADTEREIAQFLRLKLTDEEKELVAWKNAARFLSLEL